MSGRYIYIARHGETIGNVEMTLQGSDDPLTERGHEQAKKMVARATRINFAQLLSSDLVRAKETAGYVAEATGKEVETTELLRELPDAPSTAEDYEKIAARLHSILDLFAEKEEPLFVVAHGNLIRYLVAFVMLGQTITPEVIQSAKHNIRINNTGITILRRDPTTGHWLLVAVNDHAHFADN